MQVLTVDAEQSNAGEKFVESLKNTGFAVITNHPISQQLIDDVYAEWENFFNSADKNNYHFHKQSQDGFFPQSVSETAQKCTVKDIKEFYHYYPWGQFPDFLSTKTHELYQRLLALSVKLLNWVEQGLPPQISGQLSMPLSKMIDNTVKTLFRILHYPPLKGDEPDGAVRAAAHTDINMLTLLVGSTASGLQVQDREGQWHDVSCDKSCIAINIGDTLELCSKNYYKSTVHRVINPANNNHSRYSMPFFLHASSEVKLSPDITAGEFLTQRLIEIGLL